MKLVLDSGALIALERNDRAMWRRLKSALLDEQMPVTHGGVLGQAWRGRGPRTALLSLALKGVEVAALDEDLGKLAGELLGRAKKADVIDAALVLIASDGDSIVTSDPADLRRLSEVAGRHIDLVEV